MTEPYTLTDEATGETLFTVSPADTRAGTDWSAQQACAMRASQEARTGRSVLMTGPGIGERRYTRQYWRRSLRRPFRVRCPQCGAWMFPGGETCRACYARKAPASPKHSRPTGAPSI
jgi:hypothetical protein